MYENYEKQNLIDMSMVDAKKEVAFTSGPYRPYLPGDPWRLMVVNGMGIMIPVWFSGWRDETLSWHLTCSISTLLNPATTVVVRGPQAKEFLKESFVNNIDNFPVGIIKHGLLCLENGLLATHGVLMRTAEDTYEAHWHGPYIHYLFSKKKYDAELIDISQKRFLFQMQGPRCLEILEKVTGENLHDIAYRHFRPSRIDGHEVRILRFGMSGTLGYEIHGDTECAREVYKKVLEAGLPCGIRPIGGFTYTMNHIEGGFPQMSNSMISAMGTDAGFVEYLKNNPYLCGMTYNPDFAGVDFQGSAGPDPRNYMFNPFEVGLGGCINWNHEFPGKAALREIKETQDTDIVTLKWNPEDLCKIYASQFVPGQEYFKQIDFPQEVVWSMTGRWTYCTDWVYDKDGTVLGRSINRTYSHFNRDMLSFGILSAKGRALGKEVDILWGEPGKPQIKVRATVERFPYNTHLVNDGFDVSTIPSRG